MVQVIFTGPIVYQYTDQGKLGGTDLVPDSIFSFPAFFFLIFLKLGTCLVHESEPLFRRCG